MKPTPGPSRRTILAGAAGAAALGATPAVANPANQPPNVPEWSRVLGPGVDTRPYGTPAPQEAHVVRRHVEWLTASRESSVNFTPIHELDGIITPSGLCFERHHGGIPAVEPADHRLMINGLVERNMLFTMEDLKRFPRVNRVHFLECAANSGMEWRGAQLNGCQFTHGMIHCVEYTGVPLRLLLEEAGLRTNARWLLLEGADSSGMNRSLPLWKALDDCIVATRMNGEALRPEQGYPVRLVVPGWEGNIWVKWLRRIEVGDQPWYTREETSKYTDTLASGQSRIFTFYQDCKSVITSPSPQAPMRQRGFNVISGMAWSGRGTITRVDVSLDGGRNWRTARLDGLVLPKAVTRFYFEFEWDGTRDMYLQSRAIDDTGYVQPTKAELRAARGVDSIYHNNGIQTWHLKRDGEVENVEVA